MIKKLNVMYNDKLIGYLLETNDGRIAFQYDDEWIKHGFSISPFPLPLTNKIFINTKQTFDGLYGVFNDSLPDGWGELLVRRMLVKKRINPDSLSPIQKLTIISNNALGALTYEPNNPIENETIVDINLDEISNEVNAILNDDNNTNNLDQIYMLGGSSGGARPKAHITIDNEEWIVKFPCYMDSKNIGEREYTANKLAKKCGINVNDFKLFSSKICSGYFGVKRFDRKDNKRVHMISLSALLETTHRIPNLDYSHLFQVIENICPDKDDIYEAYRRMCFNVFYKNRDDHGKNFSFIYDENIKGYRLSPAYDITSTPNKFEHEMTVNGNGLPKEKDLLDIAYKFKLSLSTCKSIISKIKSVIGID